ncbi:MAG: hypothetical protein ACXVDB_01505 [Tumebacillaceae bacterium]
MFGDWSNLCLELLAIVLTGLTIKLMDDHLDVEFDQCIGRQTLAMRLGRASLPYGLAALGLAMALSPKVALSLFLASYAIGMGHDLSEKMPTRLPGWAESLIATGIMTWYAGWYLAAWSLAIMLMIQLLDDLMDLNNDKRSGQNNWANRFGFVEATLAMFVFALAAVLLAPIRTAEVLVATPLVHIVMSLLGGFGYKEKEEEQPCDT